jgi:hypothetical protein
MCKALGSILSTSEQRCWTDHLKDFILWSLERVFGSAGRQIGSHDQDGCIQIKLDPYNHSTGCFSPVFRLR